MSANRILGALGALFGFLGVAFGAFAAHTLKSRIPAELVATFETGVRYQLVHALALLLVAVAGGRWLAPQAEWAGWLFVVGILLFSGSLYVLSLTGARWVGAVTPLGGVSFLAGWALLFWSILAARQ